MARGTRARSSLACALRGPGAASGRPAPPPTAGAKPLRAGPTFRMLRLFHTRWTARSSRAGLGGDRRRAGGRGGGDGGRGRPGPQRPAPARPQRPPPRQLPGLSRARPRGGSIEAARASDGGEDPPQATAAPGKPLRKKRPKLLSLKLPLARRAQLRGVREGFPEAEPGRSRPPRRPGSGRALFAEGVAGAELGTHSL